ncbi:MAG TPA: septum formation protein Maf [Planctomycetaceae bacterium]|nr:septum formation protein Maf [Planctomycetaceae bacterium]
MRSLPKGELLVPRPLILASGSPRRAELMTAAGYRFSVMLPADGAEDQPQPGETAATVVERLAYQKAADVASQLSGSFLLRDALVIAADTLGALGRVLLGKPVDAEDARRMLRLLCGQPHQVFTGVCLWDIASGRHFIQSVVTELEMKTIDDAVIEDHIESLRWQGKAGGFGFQDGNDWLKIISGSESNVVGLPMERLAEMIVDFDKFSRPIE